MNNYLCQQPKLTGMDIKIQADVYRKHYQTIKQSERILLSTVIPQNMSGGY